ncbi:LIM domain-containing protein 1 [Elsinoe australis]|uniref:LIM domain-containing protein 1 n=1 Tax=Elsinoe australis TaxID=40998 RepID=A0A4U7AVU8_9PEZI|nr:LIM domain-containing protein 1 [Elsinoe australis]
MAMTMRAPSMLPSIKCSNCGNDVEISMMGEHICGGSGQRDAPRGNPYPQRVDSPQLLAPDDSRGHLKPTRFVPPPRIDPSAANRPYAQQNAYLSQSPQDRSPNSPFLRGDHGRRQQLPRERSAELSSNLDCAFPPFPASPMASTPRSDASSPGFFSDPNPYALQRKEPQQVRSVSPLSQHSQHEKDEAKRDEFFGRKPSNGASRQPQRQPTNGSDNEYNPYALRANQPPRHASPEQMYAQPHQTQQAPSSRGPPARPSRPGGEVDNFIASLKEDPVRARGVTPTGTKPDMRSNTFPQEQPSTGLNRRPSEPLQNTNRPQNQLPERSATTSDLHNNPYAPPPSGGTVYPPPRSSSRSGMRPDIRAQDTPPVPSVSNTGRGYEKHAPSHSGSSAASSVSGAGSLPRTGRTTPMSDTSSVSNSKSPPRALHSARGYGNTGPTTETTNPYNPYAIDSSASSSTQPQAWVPPAKSYAPVSPPSPSSEFNPYAPTHRPNPGPNQHSSAPRSLPWASRDMTDLTSTRPPLQRSGTDNSLASNLSTATTKPRHVCRGCTTPIVGKSIKAADGRLTGRYHKACFVCSTCSAPFSGTEFYVLKDKPYCEHHYHSLNGSLCTSCDRGIEGQYLETEKREKYHPRCLCCSTCREGLGEEYFDVGGRVYCERHAVAEVRRLGGGAGQGQQGNGMLGVGGQGTWRAEKRRTRLGMFM